MVESRFREAVGRKHEADGFAESRATKGEKSRGFFFRLVVSDRARGRRAKAAMDR